MMAVSIDCHSAECRYAEIRHYHKCDGDRRYAERRHAQLCCAECRGAVFTTLHS